MTYIPLPPNTALSEAERIVEMNKAIKCCIDYGYTDGMTVVHTGTGYNLQLNGEKVARNIAAPLLSRASQLVSNNVL